MTLADRPSFTNFLLHEKHQKEYQKEPVAENHAKLLVLDRETANIIENFSTCASKDELERWLAVLEPKVSNLTPEAEDLVFSMMYSSVLVPKLMKDKHCNLEIAKAFYKKMFPSNKKYMMLYNTSSVATRISNINLGEKSDKSKKEGVNPATTRFPPEPSGYLHIGHAKAALINSQLSQNGQLIVRFDDPNPEKESQEYEDAILEDLALLKIRNCSLTRSSDHFDKIHDYAVFLIKEGKAYCDNTDQEQMRSERMNGILSKCRSQSIEENLKLFEEMGRHNGYCLRAKIDMGNLNKAMRDPVIYRYSSVAHHSTGSKYKIFPTYDFSCPIVDSLEGVTLSLRTNEYRDRNDQYYWFIENLNLPNKPEIKDFSRLNFENTLLSKRKIKFYIDNGFVTGWDDPRIATLRGIKRLGMDFDVLRDYITMQNASQKTNIISWDKIWAMNKKKADDNATRYSCVISESRVLVQISGAEVLSKEVPKHKKKPDLGSKGLLYSKEILISQEDAMAIRVGEEITLMNWGNAIVRDITYGENNIITNVNLDLNLQGDYKSTKNKLSWIAKRGAIKVTLYEYGNLLNDKETEDLVEKFNVNSICKIDALAEIGVSEVKEGEILQFERLGFYYHDGNYNFNLMLYSKQKRRN